MKPSLLRRAARIKLLLMDIDGVLTDGRLFHWVDGRGETVELKGTHSQDGMALTWLPGLGIKTGAISGRKSAGMEARARMLQMSFLIQGTHIKLPAFERILAEARVPPEETAYIGDDFHDVPVMRRAGLSVAVANARPELRRIAHWTTRAAGGRGAVREVVEGLLKAQGKWPEILKRYEIDTPRRFR